MICRSRSRLTEESYLVFNKKSVLKYHSGPKNHIFVILHVFFSQKKHESTNLVKGISN